MLTLRSRKNGLRQHFQKKSMLRKNESSENVFKLVKTWEVFEGVRASEL